jgi:hypothetical protein
MTIEEIEYRIKEEHKKHAGAGLDWARIAAAKIHAVLKLEACSNQPVRSFRLKCRQLTRLRNGVSEPTNKVVNQRDYVGLDTFLKHGLETFLRYDSISYNGHHRAELYEKLDSKWVKLSDDQVREIWPAIDKFSKPILAGDRVDVQQAGVHETWADHGELWFAPYGKPERVKEYFSNDLIKVE